jgi:hypothetical protein
MKRDLGFWIPIGIAVAAGFSSAQFAIRSVVLHEELGKFFGRGHLLALVHSRGIYEADVDRRLIEWRYTAATEEDTKIGQEAVLRDLVADVAAKAKESSERVSRVETKRELNILRSPFLDDKIFSAGLSRSGLSMFSVAQMLTGDLRTRGWISQRIAAQLKVSEDECRQFYDSHEQNFFQPARLRASHVFLAAPPETPPEIVKAKKIAIEALSVRLASGEDFATLVTQHSEDEATKLRGGDLGYFSSTRMPPDFVEAAAKLRPGEVSKPIRTRLGFHIVKLVEVQAARQQTFDEVRGDIAIELGNQRRTEALKELIVDLGKETSYLRPL